MSEHQLPEDLSRWPRDPYELLGVKPEVDAKELKRAYHRLIRKFKPEQFPEHFRRIREAYDALQQHVFFYFPASPPPSVPLEDAPKESAESGAIESKPPEKEEPKEALDFPTWELPPPKPEEIVAKDSPGEYPPWEPPPPKYQEGRPGFEENLDSLWTRACEGEEQAVYLQCVKALERSREPEDLLLRLYWLLKAFSGLDSTRVPCDWLAQGMKRNGSGPCRELYRQEIESDPKEAFSERFTQLLAGNFPLYTLADLLEWRWLAAGRTHDWERLAEDVERFRPRFIGLDEHSWVRLLWCAVEQIAWVRNSMVAYRHYLTWTRELEQLPTGYFDLSRLDFLRDLSSWNPKSGRNPHGFFDLMKTFWRKPYHEIRDTLMGLMEGFIKNPEKNLERLDELKREKPIVIGHLWDTLQKMQYQAGFPPPAQQDSSLRKSIREFLEINHYTHYEDFREALLAYCLRESLLPEEFMEGCREYVGYLFHPDLFNQIPEDWSLRIICFAQRCFWM